MRKIVIAGGNGFLGNTLSNHFLSLQDSVTILSRSAKPSNSKANFVHWNGKDLDTWAAHLDGADLLINLAGKSVNCRYNQKNKNEILSSRIDSTLALGKAIETCQNKPKLWINSSSATIYQNEYHQSNDEINGKIGSGFSVDICTAWEKAFFSYSFPEVRQVAIRTAMVIGKNGPFLNIMSKIVKLRLGGRQGTGKQKVSWLHETDFIQAIEFIAAHQELSGSINLASPNPVTNSEMMSILRQTLGVKIGLPSFTWMVHLGAIFMGTEAELPLKSRFVIPTKLLNAGYRFHFPKLPEALNDLLVLKK